jgi:aspartokinase
MKKNPLNDLEQFLQQEASSLISPSPLSDKLKRENPVASTPTLSVEEHLLNLAQQNSERFYDTLIAVGERMASTKNTLLINTAIYLKSGPNWKEAVEEYWSR